jgi:predicted deacylase
MDHAQHFAKDYPNARSKFVHAARAAGLEVETFVNPGTGPDGGILSTDVVTLGASDASNVVLLNSATHGVEGFSGSGALTSWLASGQWRSLIPDVRIIVVHAINPHGFAWLRRVNEDNVDINRNFLDHDVEHPQNPDYEGIHSILLPEQWPDALGPQARNSMARELEAFAAEHGEFALQAAMSRGQYIHADGVFFGGREPVWSNRTFREIVECHVRGARHAVFLDFHTGLGPYGHAELISKCELDDPELARLRRWFGPAVKTSAAGESTSPKLFGLIANALRDVMPLGDVSAITVEYGTYPVRAVLDAVCADNWLHAKGQLDSPKGRAIKARMREMFYPDDDDWRELVAVRAHQLIRRAILGVGGL